MLTPVIDELAEEYLGKAVIGKVNVDNNPTIASEYGIRSIPSLLFFKEGKVQNQIMGAVSKADIAEAPPLVPNFAKEDTCEATAVAALFLSVLSNTAMSKYSLYRTIYAP